MFCATLNFLGRVFLALIFLMGALGNKIPEFSSEVERMAKEGVPIPSFMLAGGIVFLIAGSISLILGYKARIGATQLLIFLILATFYFHDFWTFSDPLQKRMQMIHFMKNLSIMGGMLIVIANGAGPLSLGQ